MRTKIFKFAAKTTAIALALIATSAWATVHSVDDDLHVVNWTPDNALEINILPIDSDPKNYAILAYNWYPRWQDIQNEYDALKAKYPGYTIRRSNLERVESLNLVIDSAQINESLYLLPNQNGFYAHNNLILTKAQYDAIKKAQSLDVFNYVKLVGQGQARVSYGELVETYTLTPNQCQVWLGDATIAAVEKNLAEFFTLSAQNGTMKYPETRRMVMSSIQSNCYELIARDSAISSFESLLALKLRTKLEHSTTVRFATQKEKTVTFGIPLVLRPWSNN